MGENNKRISNKNNSEYAYKILLLLPYLYIAKLTQSLTVAMVLMAIIVIAHNYIIEKVVKK